MDQFLSSLPKTFVAIAVMVIALLVLRQVQPPHTICDSQMELFREQQKRFLYAPPPVGGIQKSALVKEMMDNCKADNSPGGCFELFNSTKKMLVDLDSVPDYCSDAIDTEKQVKDRLRNIMTLMVQLAWGEKAPASYMQKNGWYDTSEISLFCGLRRNYTRFFGQETVTAWQEDMLSTMEQSAKLTREQAWPRTLLSTPCNMYR